MKTSQGFGKVADRWKPRSLPLPKVPNTSRLELIMPVRCPHTYNQSSLYRSQDRVGGETQTQPPFLILALHPPAILHFHKKYPIHKNSVTSFNLSRELHRSPASGFEPQRKDNNFEKKKKKVLWGKGKNFLPIYTLTHFI